MAEVEILYCTQCGHPGVRANPYCTHCGMPRQLTPQRRAGHVAFMLNELHASPMTEVVTVQQRARLETHYEDELRTYVGPRMTPALAGVAASAAPAPTAPSRRAAPPPPPKQPAAPR